MKNAMLSICFLISVTTFAQTPKIRYTADFFGNRYEIGDKDASQKDVILHLQKNDSEAYYQFKRGKSIENQSWIFAAIAIGGCILTVTQVLKKEGEKNIALTGIGLGATAVGLGATFIMGAVANTKYKKGVDLYNKKFGYSN